VSDFRTYWIKAFLVIFSGAGLPICAQWNETRGLRQDVAYMSKAIERIQSRQDSISGELLLLKSNDTRQDGRLELLEWSGKRKIKK
jgi:hypothetical protein